MVREKSYSLYYQCYSFSQKQNDANGPVNRGYRIHQLHLCRRGKTPPNENPEYDTKQSDGEALVMLELWGMQNTPSLPLFPGPL